jgi:hypothetical protein
MGRVAQKKGGRRAEAGKWEGTFPETDGVVRSLCLIGVGDAFYGCKKKPLGGDGALPRGECFKYTRARRVCGK